MRGKKSTRMTTFLLTRDANKLPWFSMLEAHRHRLNRSCLYFLELHGEWFVNFLDRLMLLSWMVLLPLHHLVWEAPHSLHAKALRRITFPVHFSLDALFERRIPEMVYNTTLEFDSEHVQQSLSFFWAYVFCVIVGLSHLLATMAVILTDHGSDRLEPSVNGARRIWLKMLIIDWGCWISAVTSYLMLASLDLTVVISRLNRERVSRCNIPLGMSVSGMHWVFEDLVHVEAR